MLKNTFLRKLLLKQGHICWVTAIYSYHSPLVCVLSVHAAIYQQLCWRRTLQWAPRQPGSSCGGFPTDQAGRRPLSYPQEPVSLRQLRAAQPSLKASLCTFLNNRKTVRVYTSIRLLKSLLSGSKQYIRWCWVWTLSVWSWCESKRHDMTEPLLCHRWKQHLGRCPTVFEL